MNRIFILKTRNLAAARFATRAAIDGQAGAAGGEAANAQGNKPYTPKTKNAAAPCGATALLQPRKVMD